MGGSAKGGGSSGGSSWVLPSLQQGWQPQQRQQQQRPQGQSGGGGESQGPVPSGSGGRMSATDAQRLKNIAKGAAAGAAMFGAPGAIVGGAVGGVRNPWPGTQGGSGELPQQSRADMKGRQLSGGEIPMRPGSSYGRYPPQGPPLRAGGSILAGGSDNDTGLGGNDTSDDSWW